MSKIFFFLDSEKRLRLVKSSWIGYTNKPITERYGGTPQDYYFMGVFEENDLPLDISELEIIVDMK